MYLQIPCQTLSVICMEIEGRVKLSENVHNIWISARKPVVCPQTRYCTRRNIVPKFLKNATKTLFAFCVFNNGRIYLSIPRKTKTCMLFRSNAHKNSRNFSCVHHYFFCSHQGWTLYLAHSKVKIKISFLMHNMGASVSKQWERVKFATWRSFKRMFLWIIWCSVWWMKNNYLFREIINVNGAKNVYISHLLSLSSAHTGLNRPHHLHK